MADMADIADIADRADMADRANSRVILPTMAYIDDKYEIITPLAHSLTVQITIKMIKRKKY